MSQAPSASRRSSTSRGLGASLQAAVRNSRSLSFADGGGGGAGGGAGANAGAGGPAQQKQQLQVSGKECEYTVVRVEQRIPLKFSV